MDVKLSEVLSEPGKESSAVLSRLDVGQREIVSQVVDLVSDEEVTPFGETEFEGASFSSGCRPTLCRSSIHPADCPQ